MPNRNPEDEFFMKPTIDENYSGTELLYDIESSLINYNNAIVEKFSKLVPLSHQNNYRVLDFGAVTGDLAEKFRIRTGIAPDCLEIDGKLGQEISSKGFRLYVDFSEPKAWKHAIK